MKAWFSTKKSVTPYVRPELKNEVHMQITKHKNDRRVLERGHTSGSSGNRATFYIQPFVNMKSMTSWNKKHVQ